MGWVHWKRGIDLWLDALQGWWLPRFLIKPMTMGITGVAFWVDAWIYGDWAWLWVTLLLAW